MRFALVWNAPVRLTAITTRFEPYVEGLRELGADALTVCPAGTEVGYPYPVRCFDDDREPASPEFWRGLGCDAGAVITWHRMTDVLTAMKAAGMSVLAIGDSDGQMSPWFHPWATFRFATYLQPTVRGKLGAARHWARRALFRAGEEHRLLLENTAAADVLTLAGEGPVAEFRTLLLRLGARDLADRVAWLPYPVPEEFCTAPVSSERPDRVIAVGRWDSPQKNAPLLAAAVDRLAAAGRRTEVLLAGKGSGERFARVAKRFPQVSPLGVLPRDRVRALMADCRAVLLPSRWEGSPLVANEMLALGGTVVGTPIPSLTGITAGGRSGRVSRRHTPGAFAAAVRAELDAWDRGERDPDAIAAHWRPLVSPVAVARRMLELLRRLPAGVAL
jgi:glycosyltransferase involved in cell wall biosynthesis